eukprot:m.173773 g.173773  ORF g.173773 m.173773 type:complete len:431 (+) comp15394_c0_seq1:473-1765(+)
MFETLEVAVLGHEYTETQKSLFWLKVALTMDSFAVGIIRLVLPLFYSDMGVGEDGTVLGMLDSLYWFAQIIGCSVLGASCSSWSSQKKWLYITMIGALLSYGLVGVAWAYGSISLLLCSRFTVGLIKQSSTLSKNIVSYHAERNRNAKELGRLKALGLVGFAAGSMMGGILEEFHQLLPVIVCVSLFAFNVFIAVPRITFSEEDKREEEKRKKENMKQQTSLIVHQMKDSFMSSANVILTARGIFLKALMLAGLHNVLTSAGSVYSSTYEINRFHLRPALLGTSRMVDNVCGCLVNYFMMEFFIQMLGRRGSIVSGGGVLVLGNMIQFPESVNFYGLLLSHAVISLGKTLTITGGESLLSTSVAKENLGAAYAARNLQSSVFRFIGPWYGGVLLQRMGSLATPYLEACHWGVFMVVAYVVLKKRDKPHAD